MWHFIWLFFKYHILISGFLTLLILIWLFSPRKFQSARKWMLRIWFGGLVAAGILAVVVYTPKNFEKTYLQLASSKQFENKALADSAKIWIGAAIGNPQMMDSDLLTTEYNSITPENATKWPRLLKEGSLDEYDFALADSIVDIAVEKGLRVRGHTIVWGTIEKQTYPAVLAKAIAEADDKPTKLKEVIKNASSDILNHFQGRIPTWDIVNEPLGSDGNLRSDIFSNTLGEEYISYAFEVAHEIDPELELFLNETLDDYDSPKAKGLIRLVKSLKDKGVPIHGVGLQAHHLFHKKNIPALKILLGELAALDVKIEITEFDIPLSHFFDAEDPYQAHGEYYYQFAKTCLENPAVQGLTFWGMTDAITWLDYFPPFKWEQPTAPHLFDKENHPKQAYFGVQRAILENR